MAPLTLSYWLWILLLQKLPPNRNQPVSHPVGRVKIQHRWPSPNSPVGLNNVLSATVLSEQRCEAEVYDGLLRRPLRCYDHCAFRCGETGLRWVTCVHTKTLNLRLHWRQVENLDVQVNFASCTADSCLGNMAEDVKPGCLNFWLQD